MVQHQHSLDQVECFRVAPAYPAVRYRVLERYSLNPIDSLPELVRYFHSVLIYVFNNAFPADNACDRVDEVRGVVCVEHVDLVRKDLEENDAGAPDIERVVVEAVLEEQLRSFVVLSGNVDGIAVAAKRMVELDKAPVSNNDLRLGIGAENVEWLDVFLKLFFKYYKII